jgi:hypothetical protein
MKKTLNEEVTRIKSIMGCCKGKLNENEADCVNPESDEGQKIMDDIIGFVEYDIKQTGIDNTDIQYNPQETPEILDAKKKIAEMLNPVLPNASVDEIKVMIKEIRKTVRQRKQGKKVEPQPMNEQAGAAAAALSEVQLFLASIPTGTFIIIGAWLLLRLVKCQIYYIVARMSGTVCGFNVNENILVKLMQLGFLDFRNLLNTQDGGLYGCNFMRD